MRVGLFFGSFNPIHQGHLIIGQFILNQASLDEVWFVVSPQNPLKAPKDLYDGEDRLKMVKLAVEGNPNFKASDIEFNMPRPSYTSSTLKELQKKHPKIEFTLIMGTDNLQHFDKWKDFEDILMSNDIIAYFREGFSGGEYAKNQKVRIMKGPVLNIASTLIRGLLRMKRPVSYMVPQKVEDYLYKLRDQ
mgnify:FL=1